MAAVNHRLVLAERPTGRVTPDTVCMEQQDVPEPGPGQALVRVEWLSIDPTIRTWMDDVRGYLPPIGIGDVIRSGGIGRVERSNSDRYRPGDLVYGTLGWQEWAIVDEAGAAARPIPPAIEPTAALGVLGVTGLTAYFGMTDVGRVTEGDVVVVSGAAGATGSIAGQVAKILGAAKVVGIAGSAEKCRWLTEEAHFDVAINYRSEDVAARLKQECRKGIDLYFDNVGGPILDACLARLARRGRVVLCGAISAYNGGDSRVGPANYLTLIVQRGRMEGFIILDYVDRFPEAQARLGGWAAEGRLAHTEHVVEGLEHAPDALNLLFDGGNTGKVVVHL
jgi:NADPH-dependent curcumin reductase CurA